MRRSATLAWRALGVALCVHAGASKGADAPLGCDALLAALHSKQTYDRVDQPENYFSAVSRMASLFEAGRSIPVIPVWREGDGTSALLKPTEHCSDGRFTVLSETAAKSVQQRLPYGMCIEVERVDAGRLSFRAGLCVLPGREVSAVPFVGGAHGELKVVSGAWQGLIATGPNKFVEAQADAYYKQLANRRDAGSRGDAGR
jgi:hypothetical protein